MTLEELLALLNTAKADAEAAPTDKVKQAALAKAQKAYDDKVAEDSEEEEEEEEESETEFDESKADERTKKYLAKLRKEAASHRTKGKDLKSQLTAEKERTKAILKAAGIVDEEDKPEEK